MSGDAAAYLRLEVLAEGGNGMIMTGTVGPRVDDLLCLGEIDVDRTQALMRNSVLKISRGCQDYMRQEHDILVGCAHPNIIPALGLVSDDFVLGPEVKPLVGILLPRARASLGQIARGPMSPALLSRLPAHLLGATAHLHESGIVHADLHSHNILLFDETWKLCDFGTASQTGELAGCMMLGTPFRSRAPEVVRGIFEVERILLDGACGSGEALAMADRTQGELDERPEWLDTPREAMRMSAQPAMDMWAIGMTLYEVFQDPRGWMGTPPSVTAEMWSTFPIFPELEALRAATLDRDRRLDAVGARHGRLLRYILDASLQDDPAQRWSASELLRLIEIELAPATTTEVGVAAA